MDRRQFILGSAATTLSTACATDNNKSYKHNYILSSCMYGMMPLKDILPEVRKTGATAIDIWPKVHGNQREQVGKMGFKAFAELLKKNDVKLGGFTQYPLGPFRLQKEMENVKSLGGSYVLCGTTRPKEPKGKEAVAAVKDFLKKVKPHAEKAEELGIILNVENHSSQFLYHPDAIKAFAEFNQYKFLKVAFAPHHLHKFVPQIPDLIRTLGDNIGFFYAQEHGKGSRHKMSKEDELLQMPGFGPLDYKPIVKALQDINYKGYIEIFMHPFPRGLPILPTIPEITAAINKSRAYLDSCIS